MEPATRHDINGSTSDQSGTLSSQEIERVGVEGEGDEGHGLGELSLVV
jgi:hypothetical protein